MSGITPAQAKRESGKARKARTGEILARLRAEYPDSRCSLDFESPLQLLVATVLAAQCTDERVNAATPALFRRCPTAKHYAEIPIGELEELVRTTGFYRNKARSVQNLGRTLVAEHGGEVPATMDQLKALPGVGRKTANVVLGNAFGKNEGVVVDTHVQRLSRRLGLTAETDPEKIERDLIPLIPREDWTLWSHLLIDHGRKVCKARKPECPACRIADLCPSAEV
ncbi:MAG TPA: endonuclease III [Thermoanaerobaculia bacterium]|jgi:endonuclease-3|nr:endonuclease III [Thermoanaerobaculia bacterium]